MRCAPTNEAELGENAYREVYSFPGDQSFEAIYFPTKNDHQQCQCLSAENSKIGDENFGSQFFNPKDPKGNSHKAFVLNQEHIITNHSIVENIIPLNDNHVPNL